MTKTIGIAVVVFGIAWWAMTAGAAEQSSQPAKELTLDLGNKVTMTLVQIPAGKFLMGSPEGEKDRIKAEGPQHEVTISKPFYMGNYEVTQEQYEQAVGKNPSYCTHQRNRRTSEATVEPVRPHRGQ